VRLFKYIFAIVFLALNTAAQNNAVYIKVFVKKNEVLLRWAPANKKVFDLALVNGYKITRTDDVGNKIVLHSGLKPLPKEDSAWFSLLRKNENAIFAVNVIYQNKPKEGLPLKEQQNNEMMAYNMFLMSCNFDAEIAEAGALFFRDKNIDPARRYTYRIEVNGLPPALKLLPGNVNVKAGDLSKNPPINNLAGIFKNKSVRLKWKAADLTSSYCAYDIERSKDSINYVKLNKAPVIMISSQFEKNKQFIFYLDTFPTVKEKYYYRIKGINHFGELSEGSNVVSAIGYEPLNSYPLIDSIKVINNLRVYLHFRMENKKENEKPKEYILMRSKKDKGPYTKIFSSAVPSEYLDEKPESANYYKVGALTYGGDTLYSFSYLALISDTIPPSPPKNLKAKVDLKGNVTLSWDKNPEPDVRGYKILKSNALHEEFVQINKEFALEPQFKDKLNLKTLTKNIYYSVVATDKRYNNSVKCTPIEVKRPDTICPVKPVLTSLELKDNGIKVNWINSSSEDVKYYVLYRSTELSGKDTKLTEWKAMDSLRSFLDTTVIPGVGYKYRLLVSDEDDNISISNNPYVKFETGYRRKLTNVNYSVDRTQRTISLKWNYPEKEIEKYVLYRAKKGGSLTIIKTLPAKTSEFIDDTPNMGNIYEYRIKPVFANGAEGIISDAIIIEF
jgi:uncharacterized protein